MPFYAYRARDTQGKQVTGVMEASTKTELVDKLHGLGYMTTAVKEASSGIELKNMLNAFRRVRSGDLVLFYIQLANMLNSGLTILMSLYTLARQIENRTLKEAVENASRQIEAGSSLSQAMAARPDIFTKLFVSMIKAGEASGHLDDVLMRYAGYFERQEDLKEKVREALFYPMVLLCVAIAVMLFIIMVVIPQFTAIYLKAGIKLPLVTVIVYKTGMILKQYWYLILAAAAGVIGLALFYFNTERGRLSLDILKLKIPIVGPLYRKIALARFARTLATLMGSGVPILQSLDITRETVRNEVLGHAVMSVRTSVEKGERMAVPMKISGEFPPDVVQMVSVGEETGNIDGMLNKIADFYDMMTGHAVKKLTTAIEPLFLVLLGGMVGFIMAAMLVPMFDMVKILRH